MQTTVNEVQLRGVTKFDLQEIYDRVSREQKTRIIYLDASYMYSFHLDDFENVKAFNMLGRYYAEHLRELNIKKRKWEYVDPIEYDNAYRDNALYCRKWHESLELWCDDRNVTLGDRTFRPIKIGRSLDRVVNDGMDMIAGCLMGEGDAFFKCRAIGDGDVDAEGLVSPDMDRLIHLIDLIDVSTTPEGGSISREGTTLYSVGNHDKETETPVNNLFSECSIHDSLTQSKMHTLDISNFPEKIPHTQGIDVPGSTTIVYMCSG